jgi:hypothetical protein
MGILQFYPLPSYFKEIDKRSFVPGQFCRIVSPFILPIPQILDVERKAPEEHSEIKFELRNANRPGDFTSRDRILPIKNLQLKSNEELLIQRAKKRPAIILCSEVDLFPEVSILLRRRGKKHCQEDSIFVLPCYHAESMDDPSGVPMEIIKRCRCLIYRQFFYIPECPKLQEGIARFDRIQVICGRNHSAIEPMDLALSDEVFAILRALFIFCITGIQDEDLGAFRDLIRESYPKL